jgi:signal transduction histidine kinase
VIPVRRLSPVPWLRDHPVAADWIFAVVLTGLLVVASSFGNTSDGTDVATPGIGTVLIIGAGTLPLAWRRRRPSVTIVVVGLVELVVSALGFPGAILALSCLVAVYSVGAHAPRRSAAYGLAVTPFMIGAAMWFDREHVRPPDVIWNLAIFLTAWVLGDNLQARRARAQALEERAVRLERERDEAAGRAVEAERSRIARELHDVVAHSMSVMVVTAGAARRIVDRDPDAARDAMVSIEQTGRQALDEMRRLLGVLRRDGDESLARAPQPSVRHLDALVHQVVDAGLPVALEIEGEPRPLAAGLDLSAYRIVQEALTNTLKHAGPATARVRLCYGDRDLELQVTDDGRGGAADRTNGPRGHGLIGMRERVALYGGELTVGPRRGGGYEVRATLPLQPVPV